jgi:hypothetical protein
MIQNKQQRPVLIGGFFGHFAQTRAFANQWLDRNAALTLFLAELTLTCQFLQNDPLAGPYPRLPTPNGFRGVQ